MNFLELARSRYSVRSYRPEIPEKEKLDYILEAVRLAPSAVNFQPWVFVVVTKPELMNKLYECYPREWFKTAPCAIIACANHAQSWKRASDGKDHADVDVAIAVEHLCLAAGEQGLGTCWICNFDTVKCHQSFNMPNDVEPIAIIPIGYAAVDKKAEKKRKQLSEIIVAETF